MSGNDIRKSIYNLVVRIVRLLVINMVSLFIAREAISSQFLLGTCDYWWRTQEINTYVEE